MKQILKSTIKKLFKSLVILISVLLVLATLLPLFVNVNHYKAEITQLVKDETGLTLDIQGDIRLSVLTGIEFSVENIRLSHGKKLIADIEQLALKLTPASLYSEQLTVSSLEIQARALNIISDKRGQFNFMTSVLNENDSTTDDDLSDSDSSDHYKMLYIKNIVLAIKNLHYEDQKSGDFVVLEGVTAELSLLPVIDKYQWVIEQPSIIVDYEQSGKLTIKTIKLPGRQIQDLELIFDNNKGILLTDTFRFRYNTKKLHFNADNRLKLDMVYPGVEQTKLQWSQPERVTIELSSVDITDLKANAGDFALDAQILHLKMERQDLYASGQSRIDSLMIQSVEVSGDKINLKTPNKRHYSFSHIETDLKNFPLFKQGHYLKPLSNEFLTQFARHGAFRLKSGKLFGDKVGLEDFDLLIEGKQNEIVLSRLTLDAMGSVLAAKGKIFWDKQAIRWQLNINSKKLNVEPISRLMETGNILNGYVSIDNDLSGTINKGDVNILEGHVLVKGSNLNLQGFNLNKVLNDFQNSQSVGMLDVGAVVLLGPAGMLVTKGNDYRKLVNSVSNKGNSKIKQLHSDISFSSGIATMKDVAFSTDKFRLAISGKINTINDKFINFNVATVDKHGCPVYKEQVMGKLSSPRVKEVNVLVSSVVNPIQSVISKVTKAINIKCEKPFYTGVVKPPLQ